MDSEHLELLKRDAVRLPRFLFRGFNSLSGGGQAGLNTTQGIVPHGFLHQGSGAGGGGPDGAGHPNGRLPTTVEGMDFEDLANDAKKHLCGAEFPTPFSSWAANFESALFFAIGAVPTGECEDDWVYHGASVPGFIAVLDTSKLAGARHLRVFHAPTLGLPDTKIEYLVRGPVGRGGDDDDDDDDDYRCAAVPDVRRALGCASWPRCPARAAVPHPVAGPEVREAWLVAGCFRRPGGADDDDDDDDDVLVAVAAAELGRQQWGYENLPRPWRNAVQEKVDISFGPAVGSVVDHMRQTFGVLRLSKEPLANPKARHLGYPQFRLMDELLTAFGHVKQSETQDPRGGVSGEPSSALLHDCQARNRLRQFGKKALYAQFDAMLGDSVPYLKEFVLQPPRDITPPASR